MQDTAMALQSLHCMVDLHLHLDGAISLASARKLADMQGISLPESDAELRKLLMVEEDCHNLNEFLEKFALPCSLLQTKEGLKMAAYTLCTELQEQGVMYAELRFAPQKSTEQGLTQAQTVEAVLEGMADAGAADWGLILCCMRGAENQPENRETVEVCRQYLGKGVCALDLAGAESLFTTEHFRNIFMYAQESDVPFTIHAGEADGAESVAEALDWGAKRIGHGVRAVESPEVMARLAAQQIPLELCPTSNLNTCVVPDLTSYPLPALLQAGIPITINTDDPAIEGTTIKREYQLLMDCFGLTMHDVKQLLLNAVQAAFASDAIKARLKKQIATEIP